MTIDFELEPHGYLLLPPWLRPGRPAAEAAQSLRSAGYAAWDGNGSPLVVVLCADASPVSQFWAGYWSGRSRPVILLGRSDLRDAQKYAVGRAGGWSEMVLRPAELATALARRGVSPTAWDTARLAEAEVFGKPALAEVAE